jgi:hypothetical protein
MDSTRHNKPEINNRANLDKNGDTAPGAIMNGTMHSGHKIPGTVSRVVNELVVVKLEAPKQRGNKNTCSNKVVHDNEIELEAPKMHDNEDARSVTIKPKAS